MFFSLTNVENIFHISKDEHKFTNKHTARIYQKPFFNTTLANYKFFFNFAPHINFYYGKENC